MDTLLLVHRVERCVVAPSRAARVREDQDALAPGHKGGGLGLAGARRAGFELLAAIARGDEPLGAPRHLGDIVVPEMFEECVERRHRSEEHTSELQSLMRISYAVFCLKKKTNHYKDKVIHRKE